MKNLISASSLCFFSVTLLAQPAIQWQKLLGGSYGDGASDISQTSDGGYIATGSTDSNDGNVTANHSLTCTL